MNYEKQELWPYVGRLHSGRSGVHCNLLHLNRPIGHNMLDYGNIKRH